MLSSAYPGSAVNTGGIPKAIFQDRGLDMLVKGIASHLLNALAVEFFDIRQTAAENNDIRVKNGYQPADAATEIVQKLIENFHATGIMVSVSLDNVRHNATLIERCMERVFHTCAA